MVGLSQICVHLLEAFLDTEQLVLRSLKWQQAFGLTNVILFNDFQNSRLVKGPHHFIKE